MKRFKENNCRFCKKVFCCVKCRKKHEEYIHDVNPDCDICVNGKIILRNPSDSLLLHIRNYHWPLHCINCNRLFDSVSELVTHNKCPISKKTNEDNFSNKTPITPSVQDDTNDSNYDSPPVMYPFGKNMHVNMTIPNANILHLTTSTPLQDNQEKHFLENISQPITPVDVIEKENEKIISEINFDQPKDSSTNRRVTFSETPITESKINNTNNKNYLKGSLKKNKSKEDEKQINIEDSYVNNENQTNDSNSNWETAISDTPKCPEKEIIVTLKINNEEYQDMDNCSGSIVNFTEFKQDVELNYPGLNNDSNSTIWSSMASLVKDVISGLFSINSQGETMEEMKEQIYIGRTPSKKRLRSESDILENLECFKKMKFTDIKCRKPINSTLPYRFCTHRRIVQICDKATQTE